MNSAVLNSRDVCPDLGILLVLSDMVNEYREMLESVCRVAVKIVDLE